MTEEALIRKEDKDGVPSEVLDDKSELTYSQSKIWDVYSHLHSSRTMGFSSPDPIQISEIVACVNLTNETTEDLITIIKELDSMWLKWWQENKG